MIDEYSTLPLNVTIRSLRREDMEPLEWYGLETQQRRRMLSAYERYEQGSVVMLVAEVGGYPVGQVWVDFERVAGVGFVQALRVFPFLRGSGLGTQLMAAAEQTMRERGVRAAELIVVQNNPAARRLYERLGYNLTAEETRDWSYTDEQGTYHHHVADVWLMRKELDAING